MPQYRYAYTEDEKIVDVLELPHEPPGKRVSYTCIGCGNPLIAKTKGAKRAKHFAHKHQVVCNAETYLHRLAKQTFYSVYQECCATQRPFVLVLEHPTRCTNFLALSGEPCATQTIIQGHDLTEYFDCIALEQRDGDFIPDLVLWRSANPAHRLYMEIAVTHRLSPKKEASGHRIIEIPITSEDDLALIYTRRLAEPAVQLFSITPHPIPLSDEMCVCATQEAYGIFVYANGMVIEQSGAVKAVLARQKQLGAKVCYAKVVGPWDQHFPTDRALLFRQLLQEASQAGVTVRSCHICRFHRINHWSATTRPMFCTAKRRACHPNDALDCRSFSTSA